MGGKKLIPLRGCAARERRWARGEQESMSGQIFGLVGSFSPLPKARHPAAGLVGGVTQCVWQRDFVTLCREPKHGFRNAYKCTSSNAVRLRRDLSLISVRFRVKRTYYAEFSHLAALRASRIESSRRGELLKIGF